MNSLFLAAKIWLFNPVQFPGAVTKFTLFNNLKFNTMKPKNVKKAMDHDMYFVNNIYNKGAKKIRVDFKHRFGKEKNFSYWIDRDYFQRNYPDTYDRF